MIIQALKSAKVAESGLQTAARRNGVVLPKLSAAHDANKTNKLAIDEYSGWCDDRPDYGWMDCYEAHERAERRKEKWNNFWKALGELFE